VFGGFPRKEIEMKTKSLVSASAALLFAGLVSAPLATAQTMNQQPPQSVLAQATTQTYPAPWYRQQSMLPAGQINDRPARSIGTGSDFDPYPAGYSLYRGGGG
jgi:hypothetical protein